MRYRIDKDLKKMKREAKRLRIPEEWLYEHYLADGEYSTQTTRLRAFNKRKKNS